MEPVSLHGAMDSIMVLETTDPSSNLGGGIIRVLLGRDQLEHSKKSLQPNAATFFTAIFPLQPVPAPDRQSSPADPPSQLQSGHVAVSNLNQRVCLPGA